MTKDERREVIKKIILPVLTQYLDNNNKIAEKYLRFMNESVKTKLFNEIDANGSFNDVGQNRVKVIGMSIKIHDKLAGKWSLKKLVKSDEYEEEFLGRRDVVKNQLLALHAPEHNHDSTSLIDLDNKLQTIEKDSSKAQVVLEKLQAINNPKGQQSSSISPPDSLDKKQP